MDPVYTRRLAMATWAPILAVFGIALLQIGTGATETVLGVAVEVLGERPVSLVLGGLLLVGAVALVHSDIGDAPEAPESAAR